MDAMRTGICTKVRLVAVAAVIVASAAACSSSKPTVGSKTTSANSGSTATSGEGGSPSGGETVTVGLLYDATGPASSADKTAIYGVKAGILLAKSQGYNINLVTADTTSTPAGTLAAAQKLVEEDNVVAVITESALTYTASSFLTSKRVPVIGSGQDGQEWLTATNMFANHTPDDTSKVPSTVGKLMNLLGVTNVGVVAYGVPASSAKAASGWAASAKAAGVKIGYFNANFVLGSTNVGPEVLGLKDAGVNGLIAPLAPSTTLALITGLRQQGVSLKGALLSAGYGGDLTNSGAAAVQAAQGAIVGIPFQPVEMHTAATKQFQYYLSQAGAGSGDPTLAMYNGYVDVALLTAGLKAAGTSPTHASLITALQNLRGFDATGLWGPDIKIDPGSRIPTDFNGPNNCGWMLRVVGNGFQLIPGADPICGHFISAPPVTKAD